VADAENRKGNGTSAALALYLLKDKKGNIELNVPIETDLENFSIGTQDIVSKASRGAAQKAALNYAKLVLQPYGSLLLLKDIAGVIAKPRFEPIMFEPGATEITENAAAYTAKIAELLANKPEMRITICGVSTMLDIPQPTDNPNANIEQGAEKIETQPEISLQTPDDAFFLSIAKQRRDNIRQAVQGYGIKGTRIFSCNPIIEKTKTKARVELSL
jgi:hypothetical protein